MSELDIKQQLMYLDVYLDGAMTITADVFVSESLKHIKKRVNDIYHKYCEDSDQINKLEPLIIYDV